MVSAAAREKIAEAIGRAESDGAELLLDGRGDAGPAGTLLGPTVVAVGDPESELAREELFGPLLDPGRRSTDLDAALEFLNGSRYGNAGAIFTSVRRGGARATATAPRPGCSASTSASPPRSPGSPSPAGRTPATATCTPTATDAVDFYTRKKVVTSRW